MIQIYFSLFEQKNMKCSIFFGLQVSYGPPSDNYRFKKIYLILFRIIYYLIINSINENLHVLPLFTIYANIEMQN